MGGTLRSIKDSLGREITINYTSQVGQYHTIIYKGFGGAERQVKIWVDYMGAAMRPGSSLKTYAELFPGWYQPGGNSFNPVIVSKIEYPGPSGANTMYFYYNSYGELSRVILPTGGGYDYHFAEEVNLTYTYDFYLFRPLQERVIFNKLTPTTDPDNPPSDTVIRREIYSMSFQSGYRTRVTTVETRDANNALLGLRKHYFYDIKEAFCLPLGYTEWEQSLEWKTEWYQVINGVAGSVLKTIENTYSPTPPASDAGRCGQTPHPDPKIIETKLTLNDANLVSKQVYAYDANHNKTDDYEYGYGVGAAGSLIRHTHTTYLTNNPHQGGANYATDLNIHIKDLPTDVTVYDGTGKRAAETGYVYDEYNSEANPVFAELQDCPSIAGHDSGFNTDYGRRGNLVEVIKVVGFDPDSNSPSSFVYKHYQYDIAGNVVKGFDERGNVTTFDFSDRYGQPNGEADSNTPPAELNGQFSFAFPTKVTNALGHETYNKYSYHLGRVVDVKDPNNVKSSFYYEDSLDRPSKSISAVGTPSASQTVFVYNDSNSAVGGNPAHSFTTVTDRNTFGESSNGTGLKSTSLYDGLGRIWRKAGYEGSTWLITDTQFDSRGKVWKVSNPFRSSSAGSAIGASEWTKTDYDALSRVTKVTTPDGAEVKTVYNGSQVTVTDQAGKKRGSETDALGRMTRVIEDPDDLNLVTTYDYDALGNLTKVAQGTQRRWFAYDPLSRLVRARNPEQVARSFSPTVTATSGGETNSQWTVAYTYDSAGNLETKTDPRNIKTTYTYDALNRNIKIDYDNYLNGSFVAYRYYDGAVNGKGRFWYDVSENTRWEKPTDNTAHHSTKVNNYDPMGRPLDHVQSFKILENGAAQDKPFSLSRTYDLSGNVKTQTYPSGKIVNYNYDIAGRLSGFTGNLGGGTTVNYATGIQYDDYGLAKSETYGTQIPLYLKLRHNKRKQLVDLRLSSVNDQENWNRGALSFYYSTNAVLNGDQALDGANNNGNILRAIHYVPKDDAISSSVVPMQHDYAYDQLNRLLSVEERQQNQVGQWAASLTQAFSYDRWGNRTINMSGTASGIPGVTRKNFVADPATNRLTSVDGVAMTYDAAGDQISDGTGTRDYDAENRMTKAVQGSAANYYFYDVNGKRVRRILNGTQASNGQETWFVYGFDGELVEEYQYNQVSAPLPTVPQKEYGYRNGALLVVWDGSQTGNKTLKWLVTDHLGSTRMEADRSGSLAGIVRHDYLPFGEELAATSSTQRSLGIGYEPPASNVKQKFGSKLRDNETGLDFFEARYFSSVQGRFTSPDEFTGGPTELFAEVAAHNPTFYADIADPQSLNKYAYCLNNPLKYVDPDGHQSTLTDRLKSGAEAVGQYAFGVIRGAVSSVSYGTVGGPQSDDSVYSRIGQAVGSIGIGVIGGVGAVGGTAAMDIPTGGAAELTGAPTVVRAVGAYAVVGATKNLAEVLSKPIESRRRVADGTEPTRADKQAVYDANRQANGGKLICESCGNEMVPAQKSQKGVKPPGNEASIDHNTPISKGGSSDRSNLNATCRTCNRKKSNNMPEDQ